MRLGAPVRPAHSRADPFQRRGQQQSILHACLFARKALLFVCRLPPSFAWRPSCLHRPLPPPAPNTLAYCASSCRMRVPTQPDVGTSGRGRPSAWPGGAAGARQPAGPQHARPSAAGYGWGSSCTSAPPQQPLTLRHQRHVGGSLATRAGAGGDGAEPAASAEESQAFWKEMMEGMGAAGVERPEDAPGAFVTARRPSRPLPPPLALARSPAARVDPPPHHGPLLLQLLLPQSLCPRMRR